MTCIINLTTSTLQGPYNISFFQFMGLSQSQCHRLSFYSLRPQVLSHRAPQLSHKLVIIIPSCRIFEQMATRTARRYLGSNITLPEFTPKYWFYFFVTKIQQVSHITKGACGPAYNLTNTSQIAKSSFKMTFPRAADLLSRA